MFIRDGMGMVCAAHYIGAYLGDMKGEKEVFETSKKVIRDGQSIRSIA